MAKKKNATTEVTFQVLPIRLRRLWQDWQDSFGEQGFELMRFLPEDNALGFWRIYMSAQSYQSPLDSSLKMRWKVQNFGQSDAVANKDLNTIFQSKAIVPDSVWADLGNTLSFNGLFIPDGELTRLEENQLYATFLYLQLYQAFFPFADFFKAIKAESAKTSYLEVQLPFIGLWYQLVYSTQLLLNLRKNHPHKMEKIRVIVPPEIPISTHQKQLPSAQIWQLLILRRYQLIYPQTVQTSLDQRIERLHPAVKAFWNTHGPSLDHYLLNGFKKSLFRKGKQKIATPSTIKKDFYQLMQSDLEMIVLQEILDNRMGTSAELKKVMSLETDGLVFSKQKNNLGQRVKSVFKGGSILDRIQHAAHKMRERPQAQLCLPSEDWLEGADVKLHDLSREDVEQLQSKLINFQQDFQKKRAADRCQLRWKELLQQLLNSATAPFLYWEYKEREWTPQWNLLSKEKADTLEKSLLKKREKQGKEKRKFDSLILGLQARRTIDELQHLISTTRPFENTSVQGKWMEAADHRIKEIQNQMNYRVNRMKEFGILEPLENPTPRMEVWLNEMLQIEKEVSPYIHFVKKAFQSALPIRRSIEFDPFRHSFDGIEFDPETTQDTDKWMRGDVMKSLRLKVERANSAQINAFALDASGSMLHGKMRNLFKILYLLVLGLEDRVSYDAFHFFGTNFVETANFTKSYTNRTLLFKILRNIARIDRKKVVFGGRGGTHISAAVNECHQRIKTFKAKMKKEQPNINYLTSLFVITDGEPSIGIVDVDELGNMIRQKRTDGDIAIKGIYLKEKGARSGFMERVFGENEYVETDEFRKAINEFIYIMTHTYKMQRKEMKKAEKKKRQNRTIQQKANEK